MAKVLKLYNGASNIDLLAGDLILERDGLAIKSGRDKVWETINLISASSGSTIRTAQENIDKFIEQARRFEENPVKEDPVWWYWQSEGESVKRAVVFDGETELFSRAPFNTPLDPGNGSILRLALKRHQQWETDTTTGKGGTGLSALGGLTNLGVIGGSSPARISNLELTTYVPDALSRYWIGIKPNHISTLAYTSLWELEDGTLGADATAPADAGASGGNTVRVSFAGTPGLAERVYMTPGDISGANLDAFVGRFLVLLRCRVNDSLTEVAVQLRQGWKGQIDQTETIVSTQYISGQTEWRLLEMGEIQIPVTGLRAPGVTGIPFDASALSIWAERISGTSTLDLDAIGLVPSEHMVTAKYSGNFLDSTGPIFFTSEIDEQYAVAGLAGDWGNIEYSFTNWVYPVIGGYLVIFGEGSAGSLLGKSVDFGMDLYPRWKTFRT